MAVNIAVIEFCRIPLWDRCLQGLYFFLILQHDKVWHPYLPASLPVRADPESRQCFFPLYRPNAGTAHTCTLTSHELMWNNDPALALRSLRSLSTVLETPTLYIYITEVELCSVQLQSVAQNTDSHSSHSWSVFHHRTAGTCIHFGVTASPSLRIIQPNVSLWSETHH